MKSFNTAETGNSFLDRERIARGATLEQIYDEGLSFKSLTNEQVEAKLIDYCAAEMARGTYLGAITRHALGLYRGEAGARGWRRVLSDSKRLAARDLTIFDEARQHLREPIEIFK